MKKKKLLRRILLCAALLVCVALCTACGEGLAGGSGGTPERPKLDNDFTEEDKKSWWLQNLQYKYTMNGGYYLCYKGAYYPIEFETGHIVRIDNAPDELFFLKMEDLYTDPQLQNRVAHLGRHEENIFILGTEVHTGYLLDGNRPAYGTILYINETIEKTFMGPDGTSTFGPDDIITLEKTQEYPFTMWQDEGGLILSGKDGVLFEEVNTVRKLYAYAKANGIAFDRTMRMTGVAYPSNLFYYDYDDESHEYLRLRICEIQFRDYYHVCIAYQSEHIQDQYFMVYNSENASEAIEQLVQGKESCTRDQNGRVVSYFDPDKNAEVGVFYSIEEFVEGFLEREGVANPYTVKVASAYTTSEQGSGWKYTDFHYDYGITYYPIWEDCKIVKLHAFDDELLVGVGKKNTVTLQSVVYPGYEFEGWYTDESYSGQKITEVSDSNCYENLYAKFRKVDFYTLTFEPHNGQTLEDLQYAYGEEVQLPALTKAFHIFRGWCTDEACSTEPMQYISSDFYGSYHLYPCFEARTYTLTLTVQGNVTEVTVRYGEGYTLPIEGVGEGFIGYFDVTGVQYTDATGKSLAPFTDGADIQLFAKYKEV